MKLTKKQIKEMIDALLVKMNHYSAKTSKDVEIILLELFNEEWYELSDKIDNTWKNPNKALINRVSKFIIKSDEFTMI